MIVTLLLACTGGDPALAPYADALSSYDLGIQALAEGRPADAVARFAAARVKDPRSVPLRLWEAKALADAGRLAEADARLTELLDAEPSVAVAWYNRAAYRVRAGRNADAADDLRRALGLGARSALEAAADPDFSGVATEPAFATILPPAPLEASVHGEEGTLFVGSRYPLEFTVAALPDAQIVLERLGADPGCLRVQRIVQDDHAEPGRVTRQVAVDLYAVGPCDATLGPFVVHVGDARVALDAVRVVVGAPPGVTAPPGLPPLPTRIPLPGDLAPPDAGFAARRVGEGVAGMGRPDRTITAGGRPPDVALEWRVDTQTRATGGWWLGAEPVALAAEGWSIQVP